MLMEFAQQGFDINELNKINNYKGICAYCRQYLGDEIGEGSGRIVFEIDDETVIKIAKDDIKSMNQNKNEYENMSVMNDKYDIFPKVYTHSSDYRWIICERVLPVEPSDFEIVLGVPFDSFYRASQGKGSYGRSVAQYSDYQIQGVDKIPENTYFDFSINGFVYWCQYFIKDLHMSDIAEVEDAIDTTKAPCDEAMFKYFFRNSNSFLKDWCFNMFNYLVDINGDNDLILENYGLAIRNGKPTIVVLDIGYDKFIG